MTYISYLRASTKIQKYSIEIQRRAVTEYMNGEAMMEFSEVASSMLPISERKELAKAVLACKKHNCPLVVHSVDRLTRNVDVFDEFLYCGVPLVCIIEKDCSIDLLRGLVMFSGHSLRCMNARTKEALQLAKGRSVKPGTKNLKNALEARRNLSLEFAESLREVFDGMLEHKLSQRKMVEYLNDNNICTIRGKKWSLVQVQRMIKALKGENET